LGDYISIKGHLKSKGVNLKIKQPIGWEVQEADRPNIVKKFIYKTNSYMIHIKDNYTFMSRNEAREYLENDGYVEEIINEAGSFLKDFEILNHEIVTVNSYPALEFSLRGKMERSGIEVKLILKCWMILYEDKIVSLQAGGADNNDFKSLENLYDLITISAIFPEQYN
jgi:hypothetical protein